MKASTLPSNATNSSVTWSVSNLDGTTTNLATINGNGVLTGIATGVVVVKATANDGSGISSTETIFIQ